MDINKNFKNSLDIEFGKLAGDSNMAGSSTEVLKGRTEFTESDEIYEKWSEKYKKSINCKNPKGFSQKAFCDGKKKKETKEISSNLVGKTKMDKPIGRMFSSQKKENKEATGASSAGQFSQPLFSEINENMTKSDYEKLQSVLDVILKDDYDLYKKIIHLVADEYKHKFSEIQDLLDKSEKGTGQKVKDKLKKLRGDKPDDVTIDDIVKKNLQKGKTITQIEKKVKSKITIGTKVEMEHTDDKEVAKKIAMDHLYEDLEYYEKLNKVEAKEATSSSSAGQYSTPKMWAKSTKKKDFRGASKTQIPGGKFVTVKEKCRKFPYCNQGDIKALNIFENKTLKKIIQKIQTKHNISENLIKFVILKEINKINDIYK